MFLCLYLANEKHILYTMENFLAFCSGIVFHRFDIRILAEQNTLFEAWPGAVLRNNLLYAAAQVDMPDKGMSLFEYCCKQLPLSPSHPLYKEMEQGHPPPFYLYTSVSESDKVSCKIQKNEVLNFSLALVGEFGSYVPCFIEAIRYMCGKGLGVDSKPFTFIDIREISSAGKSHLLSSGDEDVADYLSFPMNIQCFEGGVPKKDGTVQLIFESPVSLIKQGRTSEKAGYQEKSNGFPGFYQFVRSAAYRMEKLAALYYAPDDIEGYVASHNEIEDYIEGAATGVWLEEVFLRWITHQSTRKEGTDKRMRFTGYTGGITFRGNYAEYLPLLRCIEQLGVGEKLSYGFGKIRVEEQ